jgi:16S rRNA (guanine527-N7)-methyltransferase
VNLDDFVKYENAQVKRNNAHGIKHIILYLTGYELTQELSNFPNAIVYDLPNLFEKYFF